MKSAGLKYVCMGLGVAALALTPVARAADDVCANLPHMDHPHETISNGKVTAVVMLPSKGDGYYQGVRFDWAGSVACASYNGHKFWGEWKGLAQYSPTSSDAVMGPAEEFRTADSSLDHTGPNGSLFVTPGAIGYKEAAVGGIFLKPGVGFLTKTDEKPYSYGVSYPIADGGVWTNTHNATSVTSRQVLDVKDGYGYVYEKIVSLDKNGTTLSVTHHLKNTGTKPIVTYIYSHDFFMFDDQKPGAGITVHVPWAKLDASDLQVRGNFARAEGNDIIFSDPTPPPPRPAPPADAAGTPGARGARRGGGGGGGSAQGYLLGFDPTKVKDFDLTVENTKTGVGVEETADVPLARLYFWAQTTVVCPEGYVAVDVAPGKTQSWTLHYRLFAPAEKKAGE